MEVAETTSNISKPISRDINAPKGFHHKCQCSLECKRWVKDKKRLYAQGHANKLEESRKRLRRDVTSSNYKIWGSLTEEKRKERGRNISKGINAFIANLTEEEYQEWINPRIEGIKQFLDSLSEEELKKYYKSKGSCFINFYQTAKQEKLDEFHNKRTQRARELYDALPEEEKLARRQQQADRSNNYWSTATEEQLKLRSQHISAAVRAHLDSLTPEQRVALNRSWSANRNNNITEVINGKLIHFDSYWEIGAYKTLLNLNISFRYSNDPDISMLGTRYKLAGNYRWHPDFEIDSRNTIIEVKAPQGPFYEHFVQYKLPEILKDPVLSNKNIYLLTWDQRGYKDCYKNLDDLLSDCTKL